MTIPYEVKKSKASYDRLHPFLSPFIECSQLTKPGSSKEILHVVCDLNGSDIIYDVGASFGILPENLPPFVDTLFETLGNPYRNFTVQNKSGDLISFEEFLTKWANLSQITSRHAELLQKYTSHMLSLERLKSLNLAAFLENFWHPSIPLQELVDITPPMLPRYYSVASSMKKVGPFVHFMVASFSYLDALGNKKESITASYLKSLQYGSLIRLFLQPNETFVPPKDLKTPIIMIGPGTGLASFRGFLQEREATNAQGKNWLFTGDRQKAFDFHYEDELLHYVQKGFLKLDAAFSRDSSEKVYVQDLMLKQKKELWSWIKNDNASVYICGDAKSMAKDVQKTLHLIAETEEGFTPEESKAFFKSLKLNGRLLLDIY